MILKNMILGAVFTVAWLYNVQGASYSKVYVQNGGSDPVNFVKYGAPGVFTDRQIARLSAPPINSVLPVQSMIPPCVSPCVLPSDNLAPVVPLTNNAKFITYDAPSLPVVVAPSKDNGYEYSYVVYDENTGDQKAQRESSDGAVVRGQYSFVQPDGYVREVQYTADDLTGFNVVVKNILPNSNKAKNDKKPETKEKKIPPPAKGDEKKQAIKAKPELVEDIDNSRDIEVNIVKPKPPKAPPAPEKKIEVAKAPDAKQEKAKVPPKAPEPEKSKETVIPIKETKPVAPAKPVKDTNIVFSQPALVAYDDIIRCLQSRIQRAQGPLNGISPLTYIIIPSGGPC